MNSITHIFVFIVMLSGQSAFAGWMANADFTSCPRKYVPNTSGKEGPFATQSACNARVEQVQRESPMVCARYTCVDEGGTASGGTSAPAASGHEMDQHISNAISAGMNGQISGGDAMGLVGLGLLGNALLAQPSPAEIEARRQQALAAEQARVAAEIERQRQIKEKNDKMDADAESMLGLVAQAPAGASDEDLLKETKVEEKKAEVPAPAVPRLPSNVAVQKKIAAKQMKMLDCQLKRVFEIGNSVGPDAKAQMKSLKADLKSIRDDLSIPPSGKENVQIVRSPGVDIMKKNGKDEMQFIVKINIVRDEASGQVRYDVQYHHSVNGKVEEGQGIIHVDKNGNVEEKETSDDVEKCVNQVQ